MKKINVKSIFVITKTWFDKVNGNTYFAQKIYVNFGLKSAVVLFNPFQYGYSSFDIYAIRAVKEQLGWNVETGENGIPFENFIQRGCKKRELTELCK